MTKRQKLSKSEIALELEKLNLGLSLAWQIKDKKLQKEFVFRNFIEAFSFMNQAALLAEKLDHHPEWCNVYNKVNIQLTTHSTNGISKSDFEFAKAIEKIKKPAK